MAKRNKKKKGVVLALANQKGGVGKSVSSTNLACAFASLGKKVLLVDVDFQGNASSQLGILDQAEDLDKTITYGLFNDKPINEFWLKTQFENVFAIAADQDFVEFPVKFSSNAIAGAHDILNSWIEPARYEFDIIILDTHPSVDLTFQNAMVAADYYILPLFSEAESLRGMHIMFKYVRRIKEKLKPTLHILGCFVTKYDKSIPSHRRFLSTINGWMEKYNMPVIGVIPFSKSFPGASEAQTPLTYGNPTLPVSVAYVELAKKLSDKLVLNKRGRTPNTPEIYKEDIKKITKHIKQTTSDILIEEAPLI